MTGGRIVNQNPRLSAFFATGAIARVWMFAGELVHSVLSSFSAHPTTVTDQALMNSRKCAVAFKMPM
jgi:hypothetical protein